MFTLEFTTLQVPTVLSTTIMKVQTTVFVGNISEKASDTLVRQILLVSQSKYLHSVYQM